MSKRWFIAAKSHDEGIQTETMRQPTKVWEAGLYKLKRRFACFEAGATIEIIPDNFGGYTIKGKDLTLPNTMLNGLEAKKICP
jgi:hypothetical protein